MRRWLPDHKLVAVMDSAYAVLDLLVTCARLAQPITIITRLLPQDAARYDPAPPQEPGTKGRPLRGGGPPTHARRTTDRPGYRLARSNGGLVWWRLPAS